MRNTKMGPGAVRIVQIRAPEGAAFIQGGHHQNEDNGFKGPPLHAPTEIQFTNGVQIDLED